MKEYIWYIGASPGVTDVSEYVIVAPSVENGTVSIRLNSASPLSYDLGTDADTELGTALTDDDLFGVGVTFDTWSRDGTNRYIKITTSTVQLTVEYTLPSLAPTYHIGTQPDGATNPLAVIDELHIHSAPAETVVAKSHDRGDAEFNLVDTVPFSTEGATITYSDTSVTPGDAPIYQIYSFNLAGETELQTLVQGSTVSLPNAPTNLQVTNGITQAQLTWTVSSDLGGGSNMGSAVYQSTDNLNWTLLAQQSSTTPAYTDTTANVLGQTYYYKVATVNEAGIGATSAVANVLIADSPDAPTGSNSNYSSSQSCSTYMEHTK